jgi:hypothetical protein
MIVPININSDDITSQFSATREDVENILDYIVKETTSRYADYWHHAASVGLHSTRRRYLNNLNVVDEGRLRGAVVLDYTKDPLVKMIEEGASAFDMKVGFQRSKNVKFKEDGGWYLTIPFRIGVPGDVGEGGGIGTIMPESVHRAAKQLEPRKQLKNEDLDEKDRIINARPGVSSIPESKTFLEYKHKASIFQGVMKNTDDVTGQNTYFSFRRVSDNSDDNSWVYRGLVAYQFAEKAFNDFEPNMQDFLTTTLDDALTYFGIE